MRCFKRLGNVRAFTGVRQSECNVLWAEEACRYDLLVRVRVD